MPQEPGATIRIDGDLYRELRAIAEARDVTLRQAMDFWIDRVVKEREDARKDTEAKTGAGRRKSGKGGKRTRKPKTVGQLIDKAIDPWVEFFGP